MTVTESVLFLQRKIGLIEKELSRKHKIELHLENEIEK